MNISCSASLQQLGEEEREGKRGEEMGREGRKRWEER